MNAVPQQVSELTFLLRAGDGYGSMLIGLGIVLTIWGWLDLLFVRNRTVLILHALLSFTPGLLALWGIHSAYEAYTAMAVSPTPPKPAEFAAAINLAMACGIWGIAGTVVSGFFGVLALATRGKVRIV